MEIAVVVAGVAVFAWLLIIVIRRDVRKQLPLFVCYVVWELAASCIQVVLLSTNRHLYFSIYWWMEAVEVTLIVAAVRESFLRIFEGFTAKSGFRWTVWSVIAGVVLYSAWKAVYAPPVQSTRLGAFVLGSEFAFRWGIAAIEVLTTVLMLLLQEPINTREDAVVAGFGVASITIVANVVIVSLSGTKYLFFSKYLASVGYFAAAFLWIWIFSRPVAEFGFKELGMGPEDIAKELRRYRELTERIMRKKW